MHPGWSCIQLVYGNHPFYCRADTANLEPPRLPSACALAFPAWCTGFLLLQRRCGQRFARCAATSAAVLVCLRGDSFELALHSRNRQRSASSRVSYRHGWRRTTCGSGTLPAEGPAKTSRLSYKYLYHLTHLPKLITRLANYEDKL